MPKKVVTPKKRHLPVEPKKHLKKLMESPKKIKIRIKSTKKPKGDVTLGPAQKSQPPAGVFEPTVDLELQIPDSIIIKADFVNQMRPVISGPQTGKVVDSLLTKTMGHLIMKRKTKKRINRTGFPTPKKKKVVPKEAKKEIKVKSYLTFFRIEKFQCIYF